MKTLAELKRRLTPGTVFSCEHHLRPAISGPRTVLRLQTNAVCYTFRKDNKPEVGWTDFPRVSLLRFLGDDRVTFLNDDGVPVFTYTVPAK